MTDLRTLLTEAQVAATRLNLSLYKFRSRLPALLKDGFPRPVFGAGAYARWDPVAIDLWLDAKIPAEARATLTALAAEAGANAALAGKIAAELDANAQRLAGAPEGTA